MTLSSFMLQSHQQFRSGLLTWLQSIMRVKVEAARQMDLSQGWACSTRGICHGLYWWGGGRPDGTFQRGF